LFYLTTIQHALEERRQQQEQQQPSQVPSYRIRTASLDNANKLLRSGLFTPKEVSYFLGISLAAVESEQAKTEEYERGKRDFLFTGRLPGETGVIVHQGNRTCLYH
jgi:hypothetical protein